MALSDKAQNNNIVIVDNISLKIPKTKEFIKILNNLKIETNKVLNAYFYIKESYILNVGKM